MGCLVLFLDRSAAFDTVDADMLLDILHNHVALRDDALSWFRCYLRGRTQQSRVVSESLPVVPLQYGVSKGWVLGPMLSILYSLYTSAHYRLISRDTMCAITSLRMILFCSTLPKNKVASRAIMTVKPLRDSDPNVKMQAVRKIWCHMRILMRPRSPLHWWEEGDGRRLEHIVNDEKRLKTMKNIL